MLRPMEQGLGIAAARSPALVAKAAVAVVTVAVMPVPIVRWFGLFLGVREERPQDVVGLRKSVALEGDRRSGGILELFR